MNTSPLPVAAATAPLAEPNYLRQRMAPLPGDILYIHLSDLLLGLQQVCRSEPGRVLDFGCGGSPYRELFHGNPYHRADLPGTPGLDFVLQEDSTIEAPAESYNLVLSTQVLEHVRHPDAYLRECFRLLQPGGRLLVSTHGIYEDHGCPYDFHRWTADGLRGALAEAGFQVCSVRKLTCGARALVFLARRFQSTLVTADRAPMAWGLRILQRILRSHPATVDSFCDRAFPEQDRVREMKTDDPGPVIYIGLLIEAQKTSSRSTATP